MDPLLILPIAAALPTVTVYLRLAHRARGHAVAAVYTFVAAVLMAVIAVYLIAFTLGLTQAQFGIYARIVFTCVIVGMLAIGVHLLGRGET